jgi:hypothetical protein
MALTVNDHIKAIGMINGNPIPIIEVVKATGTTWLKGAVIIMTSGLAVEAADGPTTGTIVGIAMEAAVSGKLTALVHPVLPGVLFSMRLGTGDTGGDYTSAITDRYLAYGISLEGTTGTWYINQADTSDVAVLITRFIDTIGDNLALVEVTFIDSVYGAQT